MYMLVQVLLIRLNPPLRLTSSQPRERLDGTIYCDANELVNTNLFADCHKLFVRE